MSEKKFDELIGESTTNEDDYFEIRSMLPQQVMRIMWDGFSNAVDCAETTKEYDDINFAATMYSNLVDAANDLSSLQAEFWIGRADGYLPHFWCLWMKWVEQWNHGLCDTFDS